MTNKFFSRKPGPGGHFVLRFSLAIAFIVVISAGSVVAFAAPRRTESSPVTAQYGDTTGPAVSVSVSTGLLGGRATVNVRYSDPSGIETSSVHVAVDGRPLSCSVTSTGASCAVSGLFLGFHTASGSVADTLGNTSTFSTGFLTLL